MKMNLIFTVLMIIASCSVDNKTDNENVMNLKNYYYPLNNQKIVYKYLTTKGDKDIVGYEVLWTTFSTDTTVHREIYTDQFVRYVTHEYQIKDDGVFYKKAIVHKREPHLPNDIKFDIKRDSIFLWKSNSKPYCLAYNDNRYDMFRQRHFQGTGENFKLDNKTYKTVKFSDDLWVDNNGRKTNESKREIVYAEQLGVVSEKSKLFNGMTSERKLIEILNYDDWKNNLNGL